MLCPYCNTKFSWDEPCFCHPPVRARAAQPVMVAEPVVESGMVEFQARVPPEAAIAD